MYVEPVYFMNRLRKELRRGAPGIIEIWRDLRRARVTKEADNLFIYHSPLYAPVSGRFPLDKISWWMWNFLFKRTMKSYGFTKPIIWLSQPNMSCFIGNFNEKLSIYHVVDEYLSYGEKDIESRAKLEEHERVLLKKADRSEP